MTDTKNFTCQKWQVVANATKGICMSLKVNSVKQEINCLYNLNASKS